MTAEMRGRPDAGPARDATVHVATSVDSVWSEVLAALRRDAHEPLRLPVDELMAGTSEATTSPPAVLVLDEELWRTLPADRLPDEPSVIVLTSGEHEEPATDPEDPPEAGPQETMAERARSSGVYPEFVSIGSPSLAPRLRGALERAGLRRESREQQRTLGAMESRFTDIIERMADGVVLVDGEGIVRFANPAAERLFGQSVERLVGAPFGFPVVVGENTEIDVVRAGGETRAAELRVVETTWEGEPMRLVTLRDTTDRRRSEERARRLAREQAARTAAEDDARRASLLADASDLLFSSLDPETSLIRLARFCVRHLGQYVTVDARGSPGALRRVAALGPGSGDAPPPEEPETIPLDESPRSPQARVFHSGTHELVRDVTPDWLATLAQGPEHRAYLRDLGLTSAIVVPIHDREGVRGVITVGTCESAPKLGPTDRRLLADLGRRAGLALDNARLYQEAAEGNRAKSDFLTIVSHELRTPLSAIMGYANLLQEGIAGEMEAAQADYVERILSSTAHLLEIINEILIFVDTGAAFGDLHLAYEDLGEIFHELRATAEPLARQQGLDLRVRPPRRDVVIYTDGPKVRKILLNLLTNAVMFTPSGSVTLEGAVKPGTVRFRVSDTGVGIPPEKLEEIFQPFRQLENVRTRQSGGLGLGLSIARRFTELLGGRIVVESTPGSGSTFTVTLPRDSGSGDPDRTEPSGSRESHDSALQENGRA